MQEHALYGKGIYLFYRNVAFVDREGEQDFQPTKVFLYAGSKYNDKTDCNTSIVEENLKITDCHQSINEMRYHIGIGIN